LLLKAGRLLSGLPENRSSNASGKRLPIPRGTHDLIGEDQRRHMHVVDNARRIAATYGFDEWSTPIFEDTRVLARTLGETSGVVTKEMYTFNDRSGDSITLRPETTAGVCRALVANGLTQSLPQKVFFTGTTFHSERPQRGICYRQFHYIDIEPIGPSERLVWTILVPRSFPNPKFQGG
jgi:histidyl-tRNA synthetase